MTVPEMYDEPVGTHLIHEDERVRVWTLELEPGASTTFHQHQCDYVYVVVADGETVTETVDGSEDRNIDRVGDAVYHEAGLPHRLRNEGERPYLNIIVELVGHRRVTVAG